MKVLLLQPSCNAGMNKINNKRTSIWKAYFFCLIVTTICFGICFHGFNNGSWTNEGARATQVFLFIFFVVFLPILMTACTPVRRKMDQIAGGIKNLYSNRKRYVAKSIVTILEVTVAVLLGVILNKLCVVFVWHRTLGIGGSAFWISFCLILFVLFKWRNSIWQKMNIVFSFLAIILGIYFIVSTPPMVGISWDDQIHYGNTMSIIQHLDGSLNTVDDYMSQDITAYTISTSFSQVDNKKSGLEEKTVARYINRINSEYEKNQQVKKDVRKLRVSSIAYFPYVIGILIGRSFSLKWSEIFIAGRIVNLLFYVTLFSLSIKKINRGKLLCAVIGLIPTSLFMACSYSYDPWVIAWITLGMAEYISILQGSTKIATSKWVGILLIFIIGCLPKAVYFPIMFPMLFTPSSYFFNRKQEILLKSLTVAFAFLLIATFMLPILFSGWGSGDSRGGGNVNSTGQVDFILQHPKRAIKILGSFMINYLIGFNDGENYLQNYAYLGQGKYETLTLIILFSIGVLDSGVENEKRRRIRISGLIGTISSIVLVILALYVSFNEVGTTDIHGVQNRYILPLLFPLIVFLSPRGEKKKLDNSMNAVLPLAAVSSIFLYNIYHLCIIYY